MTTATTNDTLLSALYAAHAESALRGNNSHQALVLAAHGSGDYLKSICAALMTVGGVHAPLLDTYDLLSCEDLPAAIHRLMALGKKVPGWGNSFVKGSPDPLWEPVRLLLLDMDPRLSARIDSGTDCLHAAGKDLYPNPSCYTAAVAILTETPREISPYLFLNGRLTAWTLEYLRVRRS